MAEIKEQIIRFGERGRLLGLLTRPVGQHVKPGAVVIPNTGIEHRTGPHGLHVHLARALAAVGYSVFRVDLAGFGDSEPAHGQAPDPVADLRLALDALVAKGLEPRFMLLGVCSGARDAFQLARCDARVASLMLVDGDAYPTPKFQRLRWWARWSDPRRSTAKLQEMWNRLRGQVEIEPPGNSVQYSVSPNVDLVTADYQHMLDRGTRLNFIFTGDIQDEYLYVDQHLDVFPLLRGRARVLYWPHADHTLSRHQTRRALIELLLQCLGELEATETT